jgi:hypothetical protein
LQVVHDIGFEQIPERWFVSFATNSTHEKMNNSPLPLVNKLTKLFPSSEGFRSPLLFYEVIREADEVLYVFVALRPYCIQLTFHVHLRESSTQERHGVIESL